MATKKKLLQAAAGSAGGAGGLNVEDVFSTYLYTGNGSTQTITNDIDLSGEGGLVWLKNRSVADPHRLYDTVRGISDGYLDTASTSDGAPDADEVTAFNSNGFSLGADGQTNGSGEDMCSWTFRKAPKFFDVVTYTGNGTAGRTVSHNLGCEVGFLVVKRTSGSASWYCYHREMDATAPEDYVMALDLTSAKFDTTQAWNDTAPTSTHFTVGSNSNYNASGETYVAYLFAHNDGDGDFGPTGDQDIIKCGSCTTNSDGSLNLVDLGFEPQWIMFKTPANSGNWEIHDTMRDGTLSTRLSPNTTAADASYPSQYLKAEPTGFSAIAGWGGVNRERIYIAIRRGPMAVPTDATDVFDVNTYDATGVAGNPQTTGFPVDLAIIGQRVATDSWKHGVLTRLTGAVNYLVTSSSSGEQNAGGGINIDNMTGYDFQSGAFNTASPAGMYNLNWKRAPSFCDVVAYTGNSTAGRAVSHNLTVPPEMIWVKSRSNAYSWYVYHKDLGATKFLELDGNGAASTGTLWTSTPFTDTAFYLNGAGAVNGSGSTYIAYLFASVDGVSKVGSYTGNATGTSNTDTQNIECGFAPRFVLIKNTDGTAATGHWTVFDTERGIVAGNDPRLYLNTTDAEASYDYIDPYATGFTVTNLFDNYNKSNASYIFYAIA